MKQKQRTLQKDDLSIHLRGKKSEYPGYQRVEITFPDIYKSELCERYAWDTSAIEKLDIHIFGGFASLDTVVHWEDKEFFTVDIPITITEEPVIAVHSSLDALLSQGPFSDDKIKELEPLFEQAKIKASEIKQKEISKMREDTTLFRGYKHNPSAQFGHEGYCVVQTHRIKEVKGISYSEREFLGTDKKSVTTSGRVLLDISLQGVPFMDVYKRKINPHEHYTSTFKEELLKLANSPEEVIKSEQKITRTTGDGEHLTFLCSDSFAKRVNDYIQQRFAYLDTPKD